MMILTGGAGFIGSAYLWKLNQRSYSDVIIVDDLGSSDKWRNLAKRRFIDIVNIASFEKWIQNINAKQVDAVVHMGACSATTEADGDYLMRVNTHASMHLFRYCADHNIPFVYASSAATYGRGESGYDDHESRISNLVPINKYAFSKQTFDYWVLNQELRPPFWAGLKFFNVYGPNEYHKGSQSSVVYHAFPQVRDFGQIKLFKSYESTYAHGEQKRDFIYVKDVVDMIDHCVVRSSKISSGIYNVGTGEARAFVDLGRAVFSAMDAGSAKFEWIDMPVSLRSQYQYFTEAPMKKFREKTGYAAPFTSLEAGVRDYVQNYLLTPDPYL